MQVKIGLAKTTKYGASHSGDSFDITVRPGGGLSAIIADSQGSSEIAQHISSFAVNKAASLIAAGAADERIAPGVHENLYEMKDKKACTLTIVSADLAAESLVISKNSHCPILIKTDDYEAVYDDMSSPLGMQNTVKPLMYELPLTPGLIAVAFTNGIAHAGKKTMSHEADPEKIMAILRQNTASEVDYIAHAVMDYALALDNEQPGGDMTVLAVGITEEDKKPPVAEIRVTYPL